MHLHGITNFHNYAPFYSLETAVGLIMATGSIGPYLRFEPDQVNTYLSRDGGLSWVEAHKGAFIYEFGDHGGLIVMADDIRKTKQVVFSWNEGQSWFDFDLSSEPLEVDNIVTDYNATTTKFCLYGTRGDVGVVFHLNFDALGQPPCRGLWAADAVTSDYETWSPWDGRNQQKCTLGRQVSYTRRKQSSECFNGESFERPANRVNCPCTEIDFVCAVGFSRSVGSSECQLTNQYMLGVPTAICASSDFFYRDAYRKVVGDSCVGGWQPQKYAVPCPLESRLTKGAYSVLGTISMIAIILTGITYLSRSEHFKMWFNYGFESFNGVKYATIGAKSPESALESVTLGGMGRYDEFLSGEQDDYDDAPQLMSYTGSGGSDESHMLRRIETASAQVPRLQAPPGTSTTQGHLDEDVDLL